MTVREDNLARSRRRQEMRCAREIREKTRNRFCPGIARLTANPFERRFALIRAIRADFSFRVLSRISRARFLLFAETVLTVASTECSRFLAAPDLPRAFLGRCC